jgi:hypothetical protein
MSENAVTGWDVLASCGSTLSRTASAGRRYTVAMLVIVSCARTRRNSRHARRQGSKFDRR